MEHLSLQVHDYVSLNIKRLLSLHWKEQTLLWWLNINYIRPNLWSSVDNRLYYLQIFGSIIIDIDHFLSPER